MDPMGGMVAIYVLLMLHCLMFLFLFPFRWATVSLLSIRESQLPFDDHGHLRCHVTSGSLVNCIRELLRLWKISIIAMTARVASTLWFTIMLMAVEGGSLEVVGAVLLPDSR